MTKPECRTTYLRLARHAQLIFVVRLCQTLAFQSALVGLPVSVNILSRSTCSRSMASTAGAIFSKPPGINPPTLYESSKRVVSEPPDSFHVMLPATPDACSGPSAPE